VGCPFAYWQLSWFAHYRLTSTFLTFPGKMQGTLSLLAVRFEGKLLLNMED
jgi:hypothetical protein